MDFRLPLIPASIFDCDDWFETLESDLIKSLDPNTLESGFYRVKELKESDDGLTLEFVVPGVLEKNISVKTETKSSSETKLIVTVLNESKDSRNSLYATFNLDTAKYDIEKISAKLSKGILTLNIPFREKAKPKEIAVENLDK